MCDFSSEVLMMLSMQMDTPTAAPVQAQLFEASFDLVSCALVLIDDQQRILKANRAFIELLGYSLAELFGTPFAALRHYDSPASPASLTDLPSEFRCRRKDGSLLRCRSKLSTIETAAGGAHYLLGELKKGAL